MSAGSKPALRARLRAIRASLGEEERTRETHEAHLALTAWLHAQHDRPLAAYIAVRGELDLGELMIAHWQRGQQVYLPRVDHDNLLWHPIRGRHQLRSGFQHIPEPDPDHVDHGPLPKGCMLLVPGVGFGVDGRRLGQGAGFFDRLLATSAVTAIGVGFTCQRADDLPIEDHDQPCHGVLLGGVWLKRP